MDARLKKFAAAALVGVIVAGSIGVATPAAAGGYGWGHGGGYGGWHGGHGGWGHGGWGHGGWGHHRHGGWGAPVAAGILGGLALGAAAAASQPYYGYGGGYYARSCYPADQPVVDDWGNVVGYRRVRVCN
jgi:hypothetical protein